MSENFFKYANSFQAVARLRLESITCLLDILDNPHKKIKCVHVAGTNGKGSVCAFLQSILTAGGKKTGRYISPEMIDVRERITIDGQMISNIDLDAVMAEVQAAAEKAKAMLGELPTQFEIWTAAAFLYFYRQNCDIAVIETGLGGERDATNVIEKPLLSIITRIAMDHMNYLGDTLYEVASAKAGIIKQACPVITINQLPEAQRAINHAAKEKESSITFISAPENNSHNNGFEQFDYKNIKNISLGISGINQVENACLAIEAALKLGIEEPYITDGMAQARNIGRFEHIKDNIIFDGAHNPNGMGALSANLDRYYPECKKTFICGFMGDKDLSGIFEILSKYKASDFYAVTVQDNPRAMNCEDLKATAAAFGIDMKAYDNINDAIKKAANDELVIICGSLYLYKDIILS